MTGLCLLASYPKSGNTWLRALLSGCTHPDRPLDLDALVGRNDWDDLVRLDDELAVDPAMFTLDELDTVRAAIYRRANQRSQPLEFLKTHLANRRLPGGNRLFDVDCGRAIYAVRHPFDVAVSYARFLDVDLDTIVEQMLNVHAVLDRPAAARPRTVWQFMSSWCEHVSSWVDAPALPTLVVRYEDLVADARRELGRIVEFLDLDLTAELIAAAVDRAEFGRLKQLEVDHGFEMRPPSADEFFRSGLVGEGRELLSAASRRRIADDARPMLERLGYDA